MIRFTQFLLLLSVLCLFACNEGSIDSNTTQLTETLVSDSTDPYVIRDTVTIPKDSLGAWIRYGYRLFTQTEDIIGPKGSAGKYAGNEMNCQNCHLYHGTKRFGLGMITTFIQYPQYRARENKILLLEERINNCIERPLNGHPLPYDSKEMKALIAFFYWLSEGQVVGQKLEGDLVKEVVPISRAADVQKGKQLFEKHCVSCHGPDGQGVKEADGYGYMYPPLWGDFSYSAGSSMGRLLKLAPYIAYNMPFGATYDQPRISVEDAFDIGAFINDLSLHSRPMQDVKQMFPNPATKPVDFPFGPYIDPFTEEQHRLGPYQPIMDWYKSHQ